MADSCERDLGERGEKGCAGELAGKIKVPPAGRLGAGERVDVSVALHKQKEGALGVRHHG
jgi:hypothetical protein